MVKHSLKMSLRRHNRINLDNHHSFYFLLTKLAREGYWLKKSLPLHETSAPLVR